MSVEIILSPRRKMRTLIDLTGERIGTWVVVGVSHRHKTGSGVQAFWKCFCDCGNATVTSGQCIRLGKLRTCWVCRPNRKPRIRAVPNHGFGGDLNEIGIWREMINRCHSSHRPNYKYYGGRGITVCDEWRSSFQQFYKDVGPRPSLQHSIDRIDNSKGYEPGNCQWATKLEQQRNMRSNRNLTADGKTLPMAVWARELGVPLHSVKCRLLKGVEHQAIVDELRVPAH